MSRYRVTAVAIVDTNGCAVHDGIEDSSFCEMERASMRGMAAITARDVVKWTVERLDE